MKKQKTIWLTEFLIFKYIKSKNNWKIVTVKDIRWQYLINKKQLKFLNKNWIF